VSDDWLIDLISPIFHKFQYLMMSVVLKTNCLVHTSFILYTSVSETALLSSLHVQSSYRHTQYYIGYNSLYFASIVSMCPLFVPMQFIRPRLKQ